MDYEDGQVYEKLINSSTYYYIRSASGSVGCCYDVIVTYLRSLSCIIIISYNNEVKSDPVKRSDIILILWAAMLLARD